MAEMTALEQAKSLLGAMRATLKEGKILASEDVVAERVAICQGCEKLRVDAYQRLQCVVCGCGFKRKVSISGSSCPLKKW